MTIYLYVKQHSVTGLKYFGVHRTSNDPWRYKGSGKYWTNHINKHGKEHIKTLEVWGIDNQEDATYFALKFSEVNNIVESKDWANLKIEDALYGREIKIRIKVKCVFCNFNFEISKNDLKNRKILNCKDKECISLSRSRKGSNNGMFQRTHDIETKTLLVDLCRKRFRGKSYEELYGIEEANRLKKIRSENAKRKDNSGVNNPSAKTYLITNPEGQSFIIKSLKTFCKENHFKYGIFLDISKGRRPNNKLFREWKVKLITSLT